MGPRTGTITSCPANASIVKHQPSAGSVHESQVSTLKFPEIDPLQFFFVCFFWSGASCHLSEMEKRGQGVRGEEKQADLPCREVSDCSVSMACFPLLLVTPAGAPYEPVSGNVSLLGVWRSKAVLMPAPPH